MSRAIAEAAMTFRPLLPEMERAGYSRDFAAATTAAGGLLSPIIPPSMLFVIFGGFLVFAAVRTLWRLVYARCKNCGGRAFCKGSRPIYFECADCGHTHDTGWCEGGGAGYR